MMPNRLSRILAGCIFLISIMSANALAQVDTPKVELGVQFNYVRLRDLGENDTGFGGRLTYNVTDNIGVEGEYNYFPGSLSGNITSSRSQGLFGVKTGIRSESAGIFFKLRPGFAKFKATNGVCVPTGDFFCNLAAGTTRFAFDIGGVFELYPLRRTVVRFDVGDTMISYPASIQADSFTGHNLQLSVGIGLRF